MRTFVCPECGKEYPHKLPNKCAYCGCPSTRFNYYGEKEEGDDDIPSGQSDGITPNENRGHEIATPISNGDENAVRAGANIIFTCSVIFAIISVIVGLIVLFNGGFGASLGLIGIIVGAIFLLIGWIYRAFVRLFANMSERLTSIDNKIK